MSERSFALYGPLTAVMVCRKLTDRSGPFWPLALMPVRPAVNRQFAVVTMVNLTLHQSGYNRVRGRSGKPEVARTCRLNVTEI
jgi:hypothetical protein